MHISRPFTSLNPSSHIYISCDNYPKTRRYVGEFLLSFGVTVYYNIRTNPMVVTSYKEVEFI